MNIRFRQPVRIGEETRASGRIEHRRGRLFDMSGEIRRVVDDAVLAEATAIFMRVPREQADAWRDRYTGGSVG